MAVMASAFGYEQPLRYPQMSVPLGYSYPRIDNTVAVLPDSPKEDYTLTIRQQPDVVKVALQKEKDRKSIDPPPVVELKVNRRIDAAQNYLHSPYYILICSVVSETDEETDIIPTPLTGTLVSSIHRLKDPQNHDGGFFVFGDLSVKEAGEYKLKFTLYKQDGTEFEYLSHILSRKFSCLTARSFPGTQESTAMTRCFHEQGVRLRIRKDSRTVKTKRKAETPARSRSQSTYEPEAERPRATSTRTPEYGITNKRTRDSLDWGNSMNGSSYAPAGSSSLHMSGGRRFKRRRTAASLSNSISAPYYSEFGHVSNSIPTTTASTSLGTSTWDYPTHRIFDSVSTYNASPAHMYRSFVPAPATILGTTDHNIYDQTSSRHFTSQHVPATSTVDYSRPRSLMQNHVAMLGGGASDLSLTTTRPQVAHAMSYQYADGSIHQVPQYQSVVTAQTDYAAQPYFDPAVHR